MEDKPFNLSVRDRADGTDISLTANHLQENWRGRSNHFDVEVLASALTIEMETKAMKRFLVALALTCVLSVSAMAGSIPTCGAPEPGEMQSPPSAVAAIILTLISLAT
jgi:hypothetical protein